ncbi:MAG: GNAT family N-acetyltransferase [Acidobacteria bacterium]|nr:GNAT family N-acetyltransferase [Acidobacteriota bacterium]
MAEKLQRIPSHLQLETIPLARADLLDLEILLDEEVALWREVLCWDYRKTARLIQQYAAAGLMPGVALRDGTKLVGYGYYLGREELGSIGGIFVAPSRTDPQVAGSQIFSHIFRQLVADVGCRRIEGQLFTLTHPWNGILEAHGLVVQPRFYMVRQLLEEPNRPAMSLSPWENDILPVAANLLFLTYQCHVDAHISTWYRSVKSCAEFLRNLVWMPGCGEFLRQASALFLDHKELAGFILVTQIAPRTALVPQICVRRDLQGRGIGGSLLEYGCARLRQAGFQRVFLCVTTANEPARQLYLRHRFYDVQGFSAFFWNRGT